MVEVWREGRAMNRLQHWHCGGIMHDIVPPAQPDHSTTSSLSFLTLEYYQGFYDVTLTQVCLPLTSPIVVSSLGGTVVVGRDGTTEYNLADPGPIQLCMTLLPSVETLSKCHMCLSVLLSIHTPHKGSSLVPRLSPQKQGESLGTRL